MVELAKDRAAVKKTKSTTPLVAQILEDGLHIRPEALWVDYYQWWDEGSVHPSVGNHPDGLWGIWVAMGLHDSLAKLTVQVSLSSRPQSDVGTINRWAHAAHFAEGRGRILRATGTSCLRDHPPQARI